jgi:hypothetical protein
VSRSGSALLVERLAALILTLLRLFLGLFLLANGLNFWFHWLPITPPTQVAANRLMDGLVFSGLFEIVKFVEIAAGVMLLANRFVPLALVLMLPLTAVILYVDMVLIGTLQTWTFALLLAVPQFILMLSFFQNYLSVFAMRATPQPTSLARIRATAFDAG